MQRTPRLRLSSIADITGAGSLIRDVRRTDNMGLLARIFGSLEPDGIRLDATHPFWEVSGETDFPALLAALPDLLPTGELPAGAWIGTVSKLDGEVAAISSKHFFGYQLPAPPEVWEAVQRRFE
jgi:hypothetical protein